MPVLSPNLSTAGVDSTQSGGRHVAFKFALIVHQFELAHKKGSELSA